MSEKKTITLDRGQLFCLLADYGPLLNTTGKIIKHIEPGHGPCCTCQRCGYTHDECCCNHNDFLNSLHGLEQAALSALTPKEEKPQDDCVCRDCGEPAVYSGTRKSDGERGRWCERHFD